MCRVALPPLVAFALVMGATSVSQAERDPERARQLFSEGRDRLKLEDFAAACAKSMRATRSSPRSAPS